MINFLSSFRECDEREEVEGEKYINIRWMSYALYDLILTSFLLNVL